MEEPLRAVPPAHQRVLSVHCGAAADSASQPNGAVHDAGPSNLCACVDAGQGQLRGLATAGTGPGVEPPPGHGISRRPVAPCAVAGCAGRGCGQMRPGEGLPGGYGGAVEQ